VERVALVERVDLAALGDADVGVGEDKLAERLIEREAVDALAGGEDEVARRAVPVRQGCSSYSIRGYSHGVASSDHLLARAEGVGDRGSRALRDAVDTEDGADVDTGVNVGRAVEGVEDNAAGMLARAAGKGGSEIVGYRPRNALGH